MRCPSLKAAKDKLHQPDVLPGGIGHSLSIHKQAFLVLPVTKYPNKSESNLVFSKFRASLGQHNKDALSSIQKTVGLHS